MRFGFEARTEALLRAIWRHGSIAAAAATLGMDPSNAARHVRTAEGRTGAPLVERRRGGRGGNARLTAAGRRLLHLSSRLGTAELYDADEGVTPVRFAGRTLYVAGHVPQGPVDVEVPADAVALERGVGSTVSSVRNRFAARVAEIVPEADGVLRVRLQSGALALEALVVRGSVRDLRLRVGSRVWATVKASSLRVAPVPSTP